MSEELKITPWPSTPDEHRWHRFLEAARKRWGYDFVPAAKVYEAFDLRIGRDLTDFHLLGPARRYRVVSTDIVHMTRVRALKGGMYVVCFGAFLPFVPTVSGSRIARSRLSDRAHPTLWDEPDFERSKQGSAELVRRAIDPLTDTDMITGVHTHNGLAFVDYTLDHVWQTALPQLRSWFASNADLESLLLSARSQEGDGERYGTHGPPQTLVAAFTLARLGRAAEARQELERWWSTTTERANPPLSRWQEKLEELLSAEKP